MLFFCENCRTVYYAERDDTSMVITPTCTNYMCSAYGHECTSMITVNAAIGSTA